MTDAFAQQSLSETAVEPLTETEILDRLDAFKSILVPHPRMDEVAAAIRSLVAQTRRVIARNEKRRIEAGGRAIKPEELWIQPIIGPSGATKSTSLQHYLDALPPGDCSVIPVTIRSSTRSTRILQAQILEQFGEEKEASIVLNSKDYSEALVNQGIRNTARAKGTAVVALDECHNMLQTVGAEVFATSLKSIVNDAVFSLVLLGTEEACAIFRSSNELQSRCKATVDLGRLRIENKDDRDYFFGFVAYFEEEMYKLNVIDRKLNLVDGVTERASVYDMAGGVVGKVPRILAIALERALWDTFKPRRWLTWDDIGAGYRAWIRSQQNEAGKLPHKLFDPFDPKNKEGGPRWRTIKEVNLDFPKEQRLKRRKPAEAEEEDELESAEEEIELEAAE